MEQDCEQSTSSPEEERAFETLDNTLQAKKASLEAKSQQMHTIADAQQLIADNPQFAAETLLQAIMDVEYLSNQPTLRDQFAMAALTGYLANPGPYIDLKNITSEVFEITNAMLEARKS
jgi:hypothetical protein